MRRSSRLRNAVDALQDADPVDQRGGRPQRGSIAMESSMAGLARSCRASASIAASLRKVRSAVGQRAAARDAAGRERFQSRQHALERVLRPLAPAVVRDLHQVCGQRVAALPASRSGNSARARRGRDSWEALASTAFHNPSSLSPIAFEVRCSRQV